MPRSPLNILTNRATILRRTNSDWKGLQTEISEMKVFSCDMTSTQNSTKISFGLFLLKSKQIFHFVLICHMSLHMRLYTRRIFTVFTTKWFFSSMDHNMSFHIAGRFHNFLTKWATKLLRTKVNWSILESKISEMKDFAKTFKLSV